MEGDVIRVTQQHTRVTENEFGEILEATAGNGFP